MPLVPRSSTEQRLAAFIIAQEIYQRVNVAMSVSLTDEAL